MINGTDIHFSNGIFETKMHIAHLQGYLYLQETIQNQARATIGTMYAYGIVQLPQTAFTPEEQVISIIINAVYDAYGTPKQVTQLEQVFRKASMFSKLDPWQEKLSQKLARWFVDRHIQVLPNSVDGAGNVTQVNDTDLIILK